jgi:hypothetical protein
MHDAQTGPAVAERNPLRSLAPTQCGRHARCIHAFGEFIMDVAERHPQVVAGGREVAAAQLLVDRHQVEVGFSPGFANIEGALGRMKAD